jgi:hypothetical protein
MATGLYNATMSLRMCCDTDLGVGSCDVTMPQYSEQLLVKCILISCTLYSPLHTDDFGLGDWELACVGFNVASVLTWMFLKYFYLLFSALSEKRCLSSGLRNKLGGYPRIVCGEMGTTATVWQPYRLRPRSWSDGVDIASGK